MSDPCDVFLSHASEDKAAVALPLAEALRSHGLSVWIDSNAVELGDLLRQKINRGLSHCRYGVVILSRAFFEKSWTKEELDALLGKEGIGRKVVLPIRHGLSQQELRELHPTVANKLSVSTDLGIDDLARQIVKVVAGARDTVEPMSDAPNQRSVSAKVKSQVDFLLGAIQELEARAIACLHEVVRLNESQASASTSPIVAANMPSHDEYGTIDKGIVEVSFDVLGRRPIESEWMSHYSRMLKFGFPRNNLDGFQGQLTWLRLSRVFLRQLLMQSQA